MSTSDTLQILHDFLWIGGTWDMNGHQRIKSLYYYSFALSIELNELATLVIKYLKVVWEETRAVPINPTKILH